MHWENEETRHGSSVALISPTRAVSRLGQKRLQEARRSRCAKHKSGLQSQVRGMFARFWIQVYICVCVLEHLKTSVEDGNCFTNPCPRTNEADTSYTSLSHIQVFWHYYQQISPHNTRPSCSGYSHISSTIACSRRVLSCTRPFGVPVQIQHWQPSPRRNHSSLVPQPSRISHCFLGASVNGEEKMVS